MSGRPSVFNVAGGELAVQVERVCKAYGPLRALDDVSLTLAPASCTVLVGHNGAGKSTLIKLLLGLIEPDAGRVQVLGSRPAGRAGARARRAVGYLPETVALYPSLTGAETLAFYARLKGVSTAGNAALLERVGIGDAAARRVGGYSKGMRQRLALAQALLGEPRLLLLDEPTSGLDPASRGLFYEIVEELRARGAAILLSTHALAELERHADRVVVLRHGHKIGDGTLAELQRHSALPVRVRVTLDAAVGERTGWLRIDAHRYERCCTAADKLATLQAAQGLPGVTDIEVFSPSLDEIYAHMLSREEKAV
ncbi:MAG: ABC transporter ATP-binding protein [Comamonas sp.]